MALFRVYENGKAVQPRALSEMDPPRAPATASSSSSPAIPAGTHRLSTVAQLEYTPRRSYPICSPYIERRLEALRDVCHDAAQSRRARRRTLFSDWRTRVKAFEGEIQGLKDRSMMAKKEARGARFARAD